jgi:hypothetical protein
VASAEAREAGGSSVLGVVKCRDFMITDTASPVSCAPTKATFPLTEPLPDYAEAPGTLRRHERCGRR